MISSRLSMRGFTGLLSIVVFIIAAAPVTLAAAKKGESGFGLDVTETVLENGLKVILLEDHSVPVVSRQTFYHVGSRNERPGITGISHFIEHMMFNGAEKYGPKEFDRILEANGGYSNAFTSNDVTAYYEDASSDVLELLIDLDTDRMRSLSFDPKYIESEMGVVKEERRLRIDNSIGGRMREELSALAFKAHPYSWPVIGWMSDLEKINREDCVEYFKTYYSPNNAILIIAGDFETKDAQKLIDQYYVPLPAHDPPEPVRTKEPEQLGLRRAVVHMKAELPEIMIGYKSPPVSSEDLYALEVLQAILSTGRSSRLYRSLVRELGIAVRAYAYYSWRVDTSLFVFGAKMKPDREAVEGEEAIYAIIEEIKMNGVSDDELAKAKNMLEADFVRSMQTVNGKASKIGRYEILFGDYNMITKVVDGYHAVTSDDIKHAAETYFIDRGCNIVTLVPEK